MKNKCLMAFFVLFLSYGVFADSPAGDLIGFAETDGYCIVNGQRLHYWLYNTFNWHDGDGSLLVRAFISYAERLGWTVDYDTYREVYPNNELAESVKRMMSAKNSDTSMTIIEHSKKSATLVINDYDSHGYWWSRFYPLLK
jgi:hypothetical protein